MMSSRFLGHVCFATLAVATVGATAHGQYLGERGGIAVHGLGQIKAKPNQLSLELTVSGVGPKTKDAVLKFKESRRRVREAFEKMGLSQLKLEETGVSINSSLSEKQIRMMNQSNDGIKGRTHIQVVGNLLLTLDGIDKLSEEEMIETAGAILDLAKDVDAHLGSGTAQDAAIRRMQGYWDSDTAETGPTYVLTRFEKLQEQAYVKAVADARRRATRLAKLNDIRLGGVTRVHEISVSGDTALSQPYSGYYDDDSDSGSFRIATATFSEISVSVHLGVQFAIVPNTPGLKNAASKNAVPETAKKP